MLRREEDEQRHVGSISSLKRASVGYRCLEYVARYRTTVEVVRVRDRECDMDSAKSRITIHPTSDQARSQHVIQDLRTILIVIAIGT
jgi:hypothetical protein